MTTLRRSSWAVLTLVATLLPVATACAQQTPQAAEAALREGDYDRAIATWTSVVESNPGDEQSRRALISALIDTGEIDRAIQLADDLPYLRGEALMRLGRTEEAAAAWAEAADGGGPDRWSAELRLAELDLRRGNREQAIHAFDRFIELYAERSDLSAAELTAIAEAVWHLGYEESQLFQDAVMAFDEATRVDPEYIDAHIRLAELFVEKYNSPEAQEALRDAMALNPRNPRALLALAKARMLDGDRGEALERVQQALEVNPDFVEGRVFLARSYLDVENGEAAIEELNRALEINPASIPALAMLAAAYYVGDDTANYQRIRARADEISPQSAEVLTTVAEIAAQQRRYGDAADLAREATERDPRAWNSYGVRGLNEFRLGQIDAARQSLETAFTGDPYNVWIKNNLDLLDTFEDYEELRAPGFEFMLHGDEAELLEPYVEIAAAEAYRDLSERYSNTDRDRVRIELFPRSADFSVRTVGMAGMGALGVSFGDVVALDSPSAREAGQYNWLTTLWHEMAHTIAMGVSNNRVPRWFTEGLSVWEERRARPTWGYPITPEVLIFYDDEELPPVSRLNEGFMRPRSPRHLSGAYDLSSMVIDWIVETHGFDAILDILRGYRDGMNDQEVFRSVLGLTPEQMDQQFDRWLRERGDPDRAREFMQLFQEGMALREAGDRQGAEEALEAAGELFAVAKGGSPYTLLAQMRLEEGDTASAVQALATLTEFDETAFVPNLTLAEILRERGDLPDAAAALERAVWIYPFEPQPHRDLADLYSEIGDLDRAVRERRALVALSGTNRAQALYELAVALRAAGDIAEARTQVLRALELAPTYPEAQELLLQLHET